MKKLFRKIKEFAKDGLFHIFGGSVVSKISGTLSTFIVIRQLDKVSYGEYVSANNLFSYLTTFVGLGLANAALQYCSEKISQQKKNGIHAFSIGVGSMSNFLLVMVILVMAFIKWKTGDTTVAKYLIFMSGLPFVIYLHTYFQIVLRIDLRNKEFSFSSMVYSISMLIGNIVMTHFYGVPGLIISTYIATAFGALNSALILNKQKFFREIRKNRERPSKEYKKEISNYGFVYAVTGFSSMILLLLDVTCLDIILNDPTILADYKVSTTIPTALAFIPSCLIVYFYPKMVRAFSEGRKSGRAYVSKLLKVFLLINGGLALVMILGAPIIIRVGFGARYSGGNVVPIFCVLCVNYLINSVQMLYSHVLAVVKRLKANLVLSLVSGAIKIGINVLMIPWIGSMGAAISTVAVTCLITTLYTIYLIRFYKQPDEIKEEIPQE